MADEVKDLKVKLVDPTKATKEDIARGIELLNAEKTRKAKIDAGLIKGGQTWSELSDEQKSARLASGRRRNARIMLQANFAQSKGYVPTDADIDKYIKENAK